MLIAPGTRVRRYEVAAPLGAGGMGEVWLARDVELDRTVALKILPQDGVASPDRARRFLQEAKAAIALNHPNVAHVYDVGEQDGVRFIAMEYVEGETLRARLSRERPSIDTVLELATQIAAALGSAHDAGIVHRDVKPENVMVRPDGYVKVLDFGLAKLTISGTSRDESTQAIHTAPGVVMGTMHYMSPEQLRGDDVDARTDVFSLGVLLYELVSGQRPFEATTPSGVIAAILTEEPPALDESVPPEVRAIIVKAMAKKRDDRYPSASELTAALKQARRETHRIRSGDVPTQVLTTTIPRRRMPMKWIAAAAAVVVAIAVAAWFANRAQVIRNARAAVPRIEKLAEERRYFEAYDLAANVEPHLRGDQRLASAMAKIVAPINIASQPPGAQVWLERVRPDGSTAPRKLAGTTPLQDHQLPRGDYVVAIEKDGFAPRIRTISLMPVRVDSTWVPPRTPRIETALLRASDVPAGMASIPGGAYRLSSWGRPTAAMVTLSPYFIDQHEVSNRDFARFVDGGGYQRPELWKYPFEKDGRTLSFEEAMGELRDATGLHAPRGWAQQKYPDGRGDDPVTGVTWYEAAAYAAFLGKSLPTLFEWEKAARDGGASPFGLTMPWGVVPTGVAVSTRANYRGSGPMPVDSLRSGMSPYGAYHMAGNAAEWCLNAMNDGRATAGGTYDSPAYHFGTVGWYPPFYSSPQIGFRCAKSSGDQGGSTVLRTEEVPKLVPASEEEYVELLRYYDYPPAPLNARVLSRTVADAWTLEKIAFSGAAGENVEAVLFLPKNRRPPYQVIHFIPAGDVAFGARTLEASIETSMGPFIRSGRAVFGVKLPGYIGRDSPDGRMPREESDEYADLVVRNVVDERRGIDYLLSRPDIDRARIAFYGQSSGAHIGLIVAAVEKRYASVLVVGVGMLAGDTQALPHASRIHFAPRIDTPLLMVQGRWDEGHPLRTEAEPLFNLFPQPKELIIYDGGHIPPPEVSIPTFIAWWDKTLGPVTR